MKASVLTENFQTGLSFVERIASKSLAFPIVSNILLVAQKNFLELSATDLEIGIKYRVLSKNEKEGKTLVPAKLLSSFIRLLTDSQVVLEATEGSLKIGGENHTTLLKTLNPEDFPLIPTIQQGECQTEAQNTPFFKGVAQVMNVASQNQTRPQISGVLFSFKKKMLKMAATDSFRLAEKTLYFEKECAFEKSVILPQRAAREAVAVLGDKQGKTAISFSENQAQFDYSAKDDPSRLQIQLVSRLIEGEYPHYEEIVPTRHQTSVVAERTALIAQVRAASIFCNKMNEVSLRLNKERGGIEIFSSNPNTGEYSSFLRGDVREQGGAVSFNWRFLVDGLLPMESPEVELRLNGSEGPAAFFPVSGDEGYLYVLMPMKL